MRREKRNTELQKGKEMGLEEATYAVPCAPERDTDDIQNNALMPFEGHEVERRVCNCVLEIDVTGSCNELFRD
jgi:hypothetical protein